MPKRLLRKPITSPLNRLLDSSLLKFLSWLAVATLLVYRLLLGEYLLLMLCVLGAVGLAVFQQFWSKLLPSWRSKLLFSSGMVLGWLFLTYHTPAHALFFDTLETGLTTLFNRFGVTGVDQIPSWVGGVFRIVGVVFLGILAIRFGRAREEDEEGMRMIVGRIAQILAGLLIFDALIELFTT